MTAAHDETLDLLQRWCGGDRDALLQLVKRNRTWIEGRVRERRGAMLRQHAETVDDFQDLMVRVLEYAPRFVAANRRQFRGLVARMIENLLTDKARHLVRRAGGTPLGDLAESQLSLDPAVKSVTQPGDAAERNEEIAWMRLGLEFLPAEERHLVLRRQFDERSFAEIAAEDGVQPDAVRMRFNRAVLRLAGVIQRLQSGGVEEMLGDEVAG